MKRTLIALATLLPIAQASNAVEPITVKGLQGVNLNIYGTLDIGYWNQSKNTNAAATGPASAGSLSAFRSGGISPSKLGFSGDKDMGNGVKGFFTLEEHLTSTTGQDNAFGTTGFVRQAFVGFSGDFGTVIAGRQFTPAILAYAATDPRGLRESLSGLNPWLASGSLNNTFLSAFSSNSISYSKGLGPVNVSVLYALGGQVGNSSNDSTVSLGVTYGGPFTLSGSYMRENQLAASTKGVEKYSLGVGVPVGAATIKANYLVGKQFNAAGVEVNTLKMPGIGLDYKTSDKNTINVSYYSGRNTRVADDKANNWILSDEYAWAPNTTLYIQAAFIDAKAGADAMVSVLGNTSLVQNARTTVVNGGVRWNF